ncbi:MAG: RidA family protein [Deltaproteobacteria bacterium]|nr:RidA family protein [Deltaproteobacteria bacterium]
MTRHTPDARLEALLIDLPIPAAERGAACHVREANGWCLVGGALPIADGRLHARGRLGVELRLEQGQDAARAALIQALGMLKAHYGSLNGLRQCVKLAGYIAAGPDFREHARVLDLAGDLLVALFGPAGRHTRTAVGVASLPEGACVMLELLFVVG